MLKSMISLLLLFGSLALGFYLWDQSDRALRTDISVRGVYHEGRQCNGNSCSSTPFVTFKTIKGTSVTFYPFQENLSHQQFLAAFYDESSYHDGDSVAVLYDPAGPSQAFISSPVHLWIDALFWWVLGAGVMLGFMFWIFHKDQMKAVRR